jgi:hypothetical protein
MMKYAVTSAIYQTQIWFELSADFLIQNGVTAGQMDWDLDV